MAWIDYNIDRFVKSTYVDRYLDSHLYRIWQVNRYIQIKTPIDDVKIHYEVVNGRVELHFENADYETVYGDLIDYLIESTETASEYRWESWNGGEWFRCAYVEEIRDGEFEQHITDFIAKFDELIISFFSDNHIGARKQISKITNIPVLTENVELLLKSLRYILSLPLQIPDYQRTYCWEESNVKCLLDDIAEHSATNSQAPYRLGCIILHCHDDVFDIIDGQQRLVTLALLCDTLGVDSQLLDQKFESAESQSYIAYNKSLVKKFCGRISNNRTSFADRILDGIEFSVLMLQNTSLDLAYTFFSHQNSRGVKLNDYDLLKAHHLRYIPTTCEKQAYRAADVWNKMIERGHRKKDNDGRTIDSKPDHEIVVDSYLYNLRKWMRHLSGGDDGRSHRIKLEFEAAPIIEDIPPFGERFYFNEPIQGGAHFFEWVQRHMQTYQSFSNHMIVTSLRDVMSSGSDNHYRNALEALLFCYYLKFGTSYLREAFLAFLRIMAEHRYQNKRVSVGMVLDYSSRLNIVQMIDQATSPTFVLAECLNIAKNMTYPRPKEIKPIQKSMRSKAALLSDLISSEISIESFKTLNT